ncbi:MAG: tellurite resistance TerB family protein [Pseudomonadota bacterium]|nr:tellurite resistance TerB family protein [Pseudomonadota bacterium]
MFNAKMLLDALVRASARPGGLGGAIGQVINEAASGLQDATQKANQALSIGQKVDQTIGQVASGVASGQRPGDLVQKAKDVMANNPGLAEAAMIGLAGLLVGTRKSRGIQPSFAQLGGLALVGGLAYKAYENFRAGRPLIDLGGGAGGGQAGEAGQPAPSLQGPSGGAAGAGQQSGASGGAGSPGGGSAGSSQTTGSSGAGQSGSGSFGGFDLPEASGFHPVSQTEDDALLYLRAMVAAASADGQIDEAERSRIVKGLNQAGIDPEATRWLEREMANPATVEELSDRVTSPEKAAQIYTAARLAVDPDTIQEREFLRQLSESLDLDQSLKAQIDSSAAAIKAA